MEAKDLSLQASNDADIESWYHILDLHVPLAIELGRTKLTVREILNLEQESIIQLQRSTGEGVDVIAGDRYIARGDMITIEDRSGIRIKEIPTPSFS